MLQAECIGHLSFVLLLSHLKSLLSDPRIHSHNLLVSLSLSLQETRLVEAPRMKRFIFDFDFDFNF